MATKTKSTPAKSSKVPAKRDAADDLKKLLEDEIKDIYWAEKALTKALPKMIKNSTAAPLKKAMTDHLAQTNQHVKRLEDCFAALGKKAQAKKCDAMAGILEEGNGILEDTEPGAVRDAGIIAAAQKVEHYEIATYGTLAAWAKVLDEKACLKLFLQTLHEEKAADELLTSIADTNLNTDAMA
ncbi:MAG: ferritin-like domain-containing protein [Ferruginibacter sp.]